MLSLALFSVTVYNAILHLHIKMISKFSKMVKDKHIPVRMLITLHSDLLLLVKFANFENCVIFSNYPVTAVL